VEEVKNTPAEKGKGKGKKSKTSTSEPTVNAPTVNAPTVNAPTVNPQTRKRGQLATKADTDATPKKQKVEEATRRSGRLQVQINNSLLELKLKLKLKLKILP
jgi:hypothetical protein